MRSLIKKILKETKQEFINDILDKINKVGYEGLTNYEKSLLDKLSTDKYNFSSIEDEVIDWLNNYYGEFIVDDFVEKSFGRFLNKGFNFISNEMELMMKLVTKVNDRIDNTLYVNHDIYVELNKNFDLTQEEEVEILKKWLNQTYPNFDFDSYNFRLLF